ncbi:MAG: RedB protein [Pirellulaceae bacterium]|nr:RedB protein [Pirellulaceae bacterium]
MTAIWCFVLAVGFGALTIYSATPGQASTESLQVTASPKWYRAQVSSIQREFNPPLGLEMFVHPRCPCTRASLGELEKIMSRLDGELIAAVWMYHPQHEPASWAYTDLWRKAESLPGVSVLADRNGEYSKHRGATTSGHVVLFDHRGQPCFQGGITAARGHAGDNLGSGSVIAIVKERMQGSNMSDQLTKSSKKKWTLRTNVYGCPIQNSTEDRIHVQ